MANLDAAPKSPVQYRLTLPAVLAFVACMLSVYLLGQYVYRYGSWRYSQPQSVFSDAGMPAESSPAVAVVISTSE